MPQQQQQSLSHSHPGYGPPTTVGMPSGNMMPGYPQQPQQPQRYNPYRPPPQQQGLSHMPYPAQQQPSPMQGQSVMGQPSPMGQAPVGQSPMQQPPLVWCDTKLWRLWHKMHNSYKIILQILWHILCSVIASSKLEEEFRVVTRTHDTSCVIQHGTWWLYYIMQRLRKQPTCFVMSANSFPGKWCLRNECRKSVLMMSQGTWSGECFWFFSPSVWIKIILFLHSFLSLHLAGKLLVAWPNVHATYKIVMHNTKMLWHKIRGSQIMTSCSRILTVFIERFPIVPVDISCYI